ncbi:MULTISPECIES: hypothetical protein [unclassified Rathayibacter]|uniref:hypothetical protein n=1 Tax=unclassified Rathayibacter TaxID=2609250 RepID=UPI000CE74DCA|nr:MULTISPECIES: hypothetical protein [unclassified Rathayibacter]PPH74564.1 hypothetical protein C5C90_10760 [Rathayibacter sp. AY1D4]PPH85528.1 hypothetical protein C5C64_16175 [Rathayibacter sp. AY1D3]
MLPDAELAAAIEAVGVRRRHPVSEYDYRIDDVRLVAGLLDFRLVQVSGHTARIRIALPSSGSDQPWIYATPRDAADWTSQLLVWIDEEVGTGGLSSERLRVDEGGVTYVVVAPYGWRRASEEEHMRLLDATRA